MKSSYEHLERFSLRAPVRVISIFAWIILFIFISIPLFTIVYKGLSTALNAVFPTKWVSLEISNASLAISLALGVLVLISGILLILKLTKRIPKYLKISDQPVRIDTQAIRSKILRFFKAKRFTVMIVPHSGKSIINFQATLSTFLFMIFLLAVVFFGFVVTATYFPVRRAALTATLNDLQKRIAKNQENIQEMLMEKNEIEKILESDRDLINSVYSNQIRIIRRIVIGNNFFTGLVTGVLGSLLASMILSGIIRLVAIVKSRHQPKD